MARGRRPKARPTAAPGRPPSAPFHRRRIVGVLGQQFTAHQIGFVRVGPNLPPATPISGNFNAQRLLAEGRAWATSSPDSIPTSRNRPASRNPRIPASSLFPHSGDSISTPPFRNASSRSAPVGLRWFFLKVGPDHHHNSLYLAAGRGFPRVYLSCLAAELTLWTRGASPAAKCVNAKSHPWSAADPLDKTLQIAASCGPTRMRHPGKLCLQFPLGSRPRGWSDRRQRLVGEFARRICRWKPENFPAPGGQYAQPFALGPPT